MKRSGMIPQLVPDKILLDNSVIKAFSAILDWQEQHLSKVIVNYSLVPLMCSLQWTGRNCTRSRNPSSDKYFRYLQPPNVVPPPDEESTESMSYFFLRNGLLYRSYLPGHRRKRSTFRDQLVIPHSLVPLVLHGCHDHAFSAGRIGFKPTFGKIRDSYWWPTFYIDVHTWYRDCQACQTRKTAHNKVTLPTGHIPVDRLFQRVAMDLVECKTHSPAANGAMCSYVLSAIDHLTYFVVLSPVPNKVAATIARMLIERVFKYLDQLSCYTPIKGPILKTVLLQSCRLSLDTRKPKF
ncbi:unnamed protein product [Choristocarpus tenellus]